MTDTQTTVDRLNALTERVGLDDLLASNPGYIADQLDVPVEVVGFDGPDPVDGSIIVGGVRHELRQDTADNSRWYWVATPI